MEQLVVVSYIVPQEGKSEQQITLFGKKLLVKFY